MYDVTSSTTKANGFGSIYSECTHDHLKIQESIIKMEQQLSKVYDEYDQTVKKVALQTEKRFDKIDQVHNESISYLQQQKEPLHDKALQLEKISLAQLKNVELIQNQLKSFKNVWKIWDHQ